MNGIEILMLVICLVCIIMFWAMLVWPVALIGTIITLICLWGMITSAGQSWICEQMPNDPYCVEQFE
jgi:Flp pilus assembly protein TadB